MKNKEINMTIKELEAWSLFAAHAAAKILRIRVTGINDKPDFNPETVACDAASVADNLLEERREERESQRGKSSTLTKERSDRSYAIYKRSNKHVKYAESQWTE